MESMQRLRVSFKIGAKGKTSSVMNPTPCAMYASELVPYLKGIEIHFESRRDETTGECLLDVWVEGMDAGGVEAAESPLSLESSCR